MFAVITAVMRVANNRHWSGDVVTGEGVGIGVAVLVNYWSLFSKLKLLETSGKKIYFTGYPMANQKFYGIGIQIDIK